MKLDGAPVLPALAHDGVVRADQARDQLVALLPTPVPSNHAPCLLPLPGGDLLAVWFGGSDEGNPDICLWSSRLEHGSGTWTPAEQLTDDPDRSDQNPALFAAPDGAVWLLYPSQLARRPDREETFNLQHTAEVRRMVSRDGGRTWSAPEVFLDRPGTFLRQPPQVLASGRWVLPTWVSTDDGNKNGSDVTVVHLSDDEGETWRAVEVPDSAGCVHANVVELAPDRLVALFRSRYADHVYLATSEDGGETWSRPSPTELPNNNSSITALRLPSGRLGVVCNDLGFNSGRTQVFWPFERPSVTLAASDDAGRTFAWRRVVEVGDGFTGRANLRANRRHEYPGLAVDADGHLHVTYAHESRRCIKHVVVTEAWLDGQAQVLDGDCKLWS
ncbi:sialidase family protein [Nocardioides bruguierae]|uniref:sialidase family protein n=1 Tax=Nocardioides bruguierae TaxID=2945102 RepID=UPI002021A798|nr:sialidase family protein [Nocardioides bruguierae]MCL8026103.1 exo-alpha-sialidase [Nocardioides bruguierae]